MPSRDLTSEDLFSSRMMSMQSSTHSSQMKTVGPAISLRTSCWLLPQNEQYNDARLREDHQPARKFAVGQSKSSVTPMGELALRTINGNAHVRSRLPPWRSRTNRPILQPNSLQTGNFSGNSGRQGKFGGDAGGSVFVSQTGPRAVIESAVKKGPVTVMSPFAGLC